MPEQARHLSRQGSQIFIRLKSLRPSGQGATQVLEKRLSAPEHWRHSLEEAPEQFAQVGSQSKHVWG